MWAHNSRSSSCNCPRRKDNGVFTSRRRVSCGHTNTPPGVVVVTVPAERIIEFSHLGGVFHVGTQTRLLRYFQHAYNHFIPMI